MRKRSVQQKRAEPSGLSVLAHAWLKVGLAGPSELTAAELTEAMALAGALALAGSFGLSWLPAYPMS